MAKSTALNFTQNIGNYFKTFTNSDAAATLKDLFTAGADDEIVKALWVTSDDSSARVLEFLINDGSTSYSLGMVNIPITSGTTGAIAPVDVLNTSLLAVGLPLDALGKRILPIKGGYKLQVRNVTQPTAAKTFTVIAITEKY